MADDARAGWRERRQQAFASHAAADQRRRSAEAEQARRLLASFVREAHARGLRPGPLTARGYRGRTRYRTGLRGWYLQTTRDTAVGADGEFYLLRVVPSVRARLMGVAVQPHEPPLVIGEGGRDGESIPLKTLLERRLEAGDQWPCGTRV
jgi:hypothetical protein